MEPFFYTIESNGLQKRSIIVNPADFDKLSLTVFFSTSTVTIDFWDDKRSSWNVAHLLCDKHLCHTELSLSRYSRDRMCYINEAINILCHTEPVECVTKNETSSSTYLLLQTLLTPGRLNLTVLCSSGTITIPKSYLQVMLNYAPS
jgi:hypothetical protein